MADKVETKPYRLKPGAKHTHDGKVVAAGETVQLTEAQFKAFSDKFSAPDNPTPAVIPAPVGVVAAGTPGIAQDIGAKTKDPNAPVTNPDNKTGHLGAGTTVKA